MDKLLYDFYTYALFIDATKASQEEVLELESIINLQWRSRNELSELMNNFSGTCYLYCARELFVLDDWSDQEICTEIEILKRIKRNRNYVYWTHLEQRTRNKQVMSITDFINHFARPLKPVNEDEMVNLW